MPELPEVETVRRDLQKALVGRRFVGARLFWKKAIREPSPEEFVSAIAGREVLGVERRGKFLLFVLSEGLYLVVHLRMTGALLLRPPGAADDQYVRNVLLLEDGWELRFVDVRKFGVMHLTREPQHITGSLGPDPLDEGFTPRVLADALRGRRAAIKALLMDQTVVAGLGNIYADEALYAAGIHPLQPAGSLGSAEVYRLHDAITGVLALALANRGTSLRDYQDAEGLSGRNQEVLRVFRRAGEPCPRCGTAVERVLVRQRSTHFCPQCQLRRP